MADVFVSYSRIDAAFVRKMTERLTELQQEAWVDWQDIPLTAEWLEEIYAGIDGAHNFVFVISPGSVKSVTCQKELARAVESRKRLVPVLHRETPDDTVPPELAKINFVFIRDSDDFDTAFKCLLEVLVTDLDWKRAHTRLLVRAKEWERRQKNQSLLLRGEDLREAEHWQAQVGAKEPGLVPLQSQYILASRQAETRRQRLTIAWSTAALAVTIVFAIIALVQRNAARREAAIAQARQLAAQAELARATSPEASALLSVESSRLATVQENAAAINKTLPLLRKAVTMVRQERGFGAVAISPDGKYLATGGLDHTARLFALPSGRLLGYLKGGEITASVAFSPDGRYLATGSWDYSAHAVEISNLQHDVVLTQGNRVSAVAFSPDGKYLATASWDKSARVFETGTWSEVGRVEHNSTVWTIAWDPASHYVVSGGEDKLLRVFDIHGHVIRSLPFNGAVASVAISPDGRYIGGAAWDNTARVFEASSGHSIVRAEFGNWVNSIAFSPDSRYIVAGASDNTTRVFEIESGKELVRLTHRKGVRAVAWSSNGRVAASGSDDGTAIIFDPLSGMPLAYVEHAGENELAVPALAFSRDSRYLATAGFDGTARISPVANSLSSVMRIQHLGKISSAALNTSGEYLATGTWDNTVLVHDTSTAKQLARVKFDGAIYALSFSADGKYVAGAEDGMPSVVQVVEVQGGRPMLRLTRTHTPRALTFSPNGQTLGASSNDTLDLLALPLGKGVRALTHDKRADTLDDIYAAAYSADGRYVATSRSDQILRVFEAGTGKLAARLQDQGTALSLAFSPDNRLLLARMSDNSGRVIEVKTGKTIRQIRHPGGVLALAYSPDGRNIVAGAGDRSIYVTDAASGETAARIESAGPVKAVAFSAEGRYVISAAAENENSDDLTMIVRRDLWMSGDLAARICSVVNRNLSQAEWRQYFPGQDYRPTCPKLPHP